MHWMGDSGAGLNCVEPACNKTAMTGVSSCRPLCACLYAFAIIYRSQMLHAAICRLLAFLSRGAALKSSAAAAQTCFANPGTKACRVHVESMQSGERARERERESCPSLASTETQTDGGAHLRGGSPPCPNERKKERVAQAPRKKERKSVVQAGLIWGGFR